MPFPRSPNPFAMRLKQQQRRHMQTPIQAPAEPQQPALPIEKPFYNPSHSNVQAILPPRPTTPPRPRPTPPQHLPMIPQQQMQHQPPMIPAPQMQQHNPQPQHPSAQVPPEKAAAEFRRVNKNLPDGVRYEPLDDETMRLLRDNGHIPKTPALPSPPSPQLPPVQPEPPKNQTPEKIPANIRETLENLSQDERNAHIFYSHFAEIAEAEPTKKALANLAKDSEVRQNQYQSLIETHFNNTYTPKETKINTSIPIHDAIALALIEENKSLTTLGNILDQATFADFEKIIQRIINKKIISHQILMTIQTTTTPIPRSLLNPPEAPEASR